jgi:hypothetical protein
MSDMLHHLKDKVTRKSSSSSPDSSPELGHRNLGGLTGHHHKTPGAIGTGTMGTTYGVPGDIPGQHVGPMDKAKQSVEHWKQSAHDTFEHVKHKMTDQ